jgi:hypothetical protein
MRCLPLFALVLAVSACKTGPTIADPRFEMPAAPAVLKEAPRPMEPIIVPQKATQKPDQNGLVEINIPNSARN